VSNLTTDELTTAEENPYESPLAVEPDATKPSYPSAKKAFLAGAKRGAKVAGKWMGLILGSFALLVFAIICFGILHRLYRLGYDDWHPSEGLWTMVMLIVACAYSTLVAAIISAVIMGTGEVVSYWRSRRKAQT